MLVTRKAVRGGMKGVRRSVKRGQSVEFTDYRDYTHGRRPARARLEHLRAPREAVHQALHRGGGRHRPHPARRVRLDGHRRTRTSCCSASAPRRRWPTSGSPPTTGSAWPCSRAGWRAASGRPRHGPHLPGAGRPVAASRPPPARPTWPPARRHYAAQMTQRGPLILISDLLRRQRRAGHQRAGRHALRGGRAPRRSVPTSSTRRSKATSGWSTARRGAGVDITADLCTLDAYRARLAAWQAELDAVATKRRASPTCRSPRRCRSPTSSSPSCAAGGSWRPRPGAAVVTMGFLAPLAHRRPGLRPAHRRLLHAPAAARRNGRSAARSCGSSSSATSRPTRPGSACAGRCCCSSSCLLAVDPRPCSWRARSSSGRPASPATSCWSSTPRPAWARRMSSRTG